MDHDLPANLSSLIAAFPRLFRGKPPTIEDYVGPGWHSLVFDLCSEIDALLTDDEAAGFKIVQIKEKFASLRFYVKLRGRWRWAVDPSREVADKAAAIDRLIRQAEARSRTTCEVCGEPGEQLSAGWRMTLCQRHSDRQRAGLNLNSED